MNDVWLAIETATSTGGVAVGNADALLAEVVLGNQARHSAALMPAVDFALHHAGVAARELAGVVVGAGPGSFTGVRVAAATAKGMARALNVPLHAASSLAALALSVDPRDESVCALFDARRGEVYTACYRVAGAELQLVADARACAVDEALQVARSHGAWCVGEGAWVYEAALRSAGVRVAGTRHSAPRAAALLRLLGLRGGSAPVDVASWEPHYLRSSGAERSRA